MRSSSPWLYVASDPARVPDPGMAPPQGVLVKVAFRVFIVLGKPQNKPQVLELSRNKCKSMHSTGKTMVYWHKTHNTVLYNEYTVHMQYISNN